MIRIASNSMSDTLINQLTQIRYTQQKLQNQAATGLRVQNPEDDPSTMRNLLDLQAVSAAITQYQKNISQVTQQSNAALAAMQSLQTVAQRASEIASQANGANSAQDLATYATEVAQLIQEAAQAVNGKFQGGYLFGGTLTDQTPFVVTENNSGQVTGVTYRGNTSVPSVEVAENVTVTPLPVGANTTGAGPAGVITDSRTGADFFTHLIALQNDLLSGDTTAITNTDLPGILKDSDNITQQIAAAGALQSRLNAENTIAESRVAALDQLASTQADADLATVMVQLEQTKTAYQAALQSGAGLLNLSLLDYLR